MTKRVLVTGGAGLIGSHLCERLIADGNHVVVLDTLLTGSAVSIEPLLATGRLELINQDITLPIRLEVDAIYNLACPASPVHYQRDPVGTMKASVLGAINVLDLARDLGCPVLQASTSEIYGDPLVHPQTEAYWGNVNPMGPRACYDEGKRAAETLFFDYRRVYGVDTKVVRIFNTYGPNMRVGDGRVVSNLIVQALRQQPLTIFGDGSQTRSFCYVTDLVEGMVAMMASPRDQSGPTNLGNPAEITVRALALLILELTGSRSPIEHQPLPIDDPRQRQPDITRAQTTLGWAPRTPLRGGLVPTIAYFEQCLGLTAAHRSTGILSTTPTN